MVINVIFSIVLIVVGLFMMLVGLKARSVLKRRKAIGWKPATYSEDVPDYIKERIRQDKKDYFWRTWYVTK